MFKFSNRNRMLLHRLRFIEGVGGVGGEGSGSGSPDPAGNGGNNNGEPATHKPQPPKPPEGEKQDPQAKDFSRALAKRAAEIEAKYADYEELKAKAAKYDAGQNDAEARLAELERRFDEADKAKARQSEVEKVAKETGLPVELAAMLDGDGDQLAENAKTVNAIIGKLKDPGALAPRVDQAGGGEQLTPRQLLQAAYAEKN